jgi:hypothetical protein
LLACLLLYFFKYLPTHLPTYLIQGLGIQFLLLQTNKQTNKHTNIHSPKSRHLGFQTPTHPLTHSSASTDSEARTQDRYLLKYTISGFDLNLPYLNTTPSTSEPESHLPLTTHANQPTNRSSNHNHNPINHNNPSILPHPTTQSPHNHGHHNPKHPRHPRHPLSASKPLLRLLLQSRRSRLARDVRVVRRVGLSVSGSAHCPSAHCPGEGYG